MNLLKIRVYRLRDDLESLLTIANTRDLMNEEMERIEVLMETETPLFVSPVGMERMVDTRLNLHVSFL